MNELFGPDFLRKLERIRLQVQRGRVARAGDRPSAETGEGLEFQDHRGYAPGDDLREVDWNAFARLGRLFRKRYRREEGEEMALLVDLSGSMQLGEPAKELQARLLAGAFAALALAAGARVRLLLAGRTLTASSFEGKGSVWPCLQLVNSAPAGGGRESLTQAFEILRESPRVLDLVVLSDALFPEGPDSLLEKLAQFRSRGHFVQLLQVLAPQERDPFAQGAFSRELVETETGVTLDWPGGESGAARYRRVFEEFCSGVESFGRKHGLFVTRAGSEESFDEPLLRALGETGA